jgi:hypothetical protein
LPMRKKLGEEKYRAFLFEIFYFEANDPLQTFVDKYIFNPALLIGKAIEWMRKEKGE